eukprot:643911_1
MASKRVSNMSKSSRASKKPKTKDKDKNKGSKPRTSRKEKLDQLKLKIQSSNSYKPKEKDSKKSSKRRTSKKTPHLAVDDSKSSKRRRSKSPKGKSDRKDSKKSKKKANKKAKKEHDKHVQEEDNNEYYPNDHSDIKYDLPDLDVLSNHESNPAPESVNDLDQEGINADSPSGDGDGLYDYQFLDLLDRMRSSGANPKIPQIVLIGPRGCGKTSLLEIITGIGLPKGRHNPTTCPIEFNIVRSLDKKNKDPACEMWIKWRFNDEINRWFQDYDNKEPQKFARVDDISRLNEYIIHAQNMIDESNEHHSISPNAIVINVIANHVEDIRIVDLPGWINPSGAGFDEKRKKFYNDIVDIYLNEDNNNIIAFMMDALHDMNECDLFNRLMRPYLEMEPWRVGVDHQCLGIVTGLGTVHSENELKAKSPWLQPALKDGFMNVPTFIAIHTFNDYDIENNVNAIDLKKQEFDILLNHEPWSYLFDIRSKLGLDNLLHTLGQLMMVSIQPELMVWKNTMDHRLEQLMVEFKKLPPSITAKDSTAAISQIVHNFVSELEQHVKRAPGFERMVNRIEYKFLLLRKEIVATRPRLATKSSDSDARNGIYSVSDLMKLTKITSAAGHGNYNDIIHGVRHFLVESVISSRWFNPSTACLTAIYNIISTLLGNLLTKHVHQFVHLLSAIRQTMAEMIGKLKTKARREVETMLSREKFSPIVDITTLQQKVRYYKMSLKSKSTLFSSGNAQLNENIIEILSQSWAYFDIASNRYCDNIVMVIQSTLLQTLHSELQKCFTQSFLRKPPSKLEELLKLDGNQKREKKQLIQQFQNLTNNRKQINAMVLRNQTLLQNLHKGDKRSSLALAIANSPVPLKSDPMESLTNLIASVEATNPLDQIQPLKDEHLPQDEEGDEETRNIMEMQTSAARGEGGGVYTDNAKAGDELIPADFYSDYIQKKKQLDALVPKLASINAQLEAQKQQLERAAADLRKEQVNLEHDKKSLIEQQHNLGQQMDDIEKEYEELEEVRDDLEKERQEFDQSKEKVMNHIAAARERLESAARRMIEEREQFEREKGTVQTSSPDVPAQISTTGLPGGTEQYLIQQLEAQREMMKQMRDAMIEQKYNLEEEKKRLGDTDYLQHEWHKLDTEKENVGTTLQEIEEMMLEISEAEEENTKEKERLQKIKQTLDEERSAMNQRDTDLKQKEDYLRDWEVKLQSDSKSMREDNKVDESFYKNKLKLLKTKNKLLSTKLKKIKSINDPESSEPHHLSLNIGPETERDLLTSTFSSITGNDFYGNDLDGSGSDAMDTDDSYDMDYYKHTEQMVLTEDQEFTPITTDNGPNVIQLVPHSTENSIQVEDTPEPPFEFNPIANRRQKSGERRSTPVPQKKKNLLTRQYMEDDDPSLATLTTIRSNQPNNASMSMIINVSETKSNTRQSVHRSGAKTLDYHSKQTFSAEDTVQLQLLTEDMMQDFERLMNEQNTIADDIQDEIHTAFKLLETDFKSYMQKNVEIDAKELEDELQQFEMQIYELQEELEAVEGEKSALDRLNEELNHVVTDLKLEDHKKTKIITKYQEQNKQQVLQKMVTIPMSAIKSFNSSNASHASNGSSASNASANTPEIQKLNNLVASQPQSYRQYSHNSNPNNPFGDDDTDESDWEVNDDTDESSGDEERFELVATNRRELKQSLAHIEKQLHLEHGLEALALDEDEIAKLKATHYNKQDTLDKLKTLEKQVEEKDKARAKAGAGHVLPPTITEEGAEFDDEESLDDEENSWDSGSNEHKLDTLISPDLIADEMPAMKPNFAMANTQDAITDLINDCDLVSVGMDEREARQILQELMNLKDMMGGPSLQIKTSGVGTYSNKGSNQNTPSATPLQQFQQTFGQSTKNIYGEEEALRKAQERVFEEESLKAQGKAQRRPHGMSGFSDIFPEYSTTSKSEFALKVTGTGAAYGGIKQQGDMLNSMVSNQIELKLQQTQLEAAMTKMELLDELKMEIEVVNPMIRDDKRESIRISTIINLDQLADELMQ